MPVRRQRSSILRNFLKKLRKWNRLTWQHSRQKLSKIMRMWSLIFGQRRKNCFTVWTDRVRKILKKQDAKIVDVVVAGSRCRGMEQENSDLDVVVEYTGSTREDDLFNMLHEDSIYIAGIRVDINPITEGRTGTLETYLPEVETYLQEKVQQQQVNTQLVTQGREQEPAEKTELANEPVIEPETVHVTFTEAECGEFHNLGEYHEGIETIEEAIQIYQAIDPSRMNGIPSIGVNMHIEGTEEWEDEQADVLTGKYIDVDYLNYLPEVRDNPKVQEAVAKLIVAFPDREVNDRESKEYLAKIAEYKPLAKIEELEEQNYNMIDNVLNNGVEKFNREEEKKEQQEKSQARSSLKERLVAKQKEAAHGNNKDTKEQEKSKNSHREM